MMLEDIVKRNLYYCEDSPSFLRWKVDRMCGMHMHMFRKRKGDVAGNIKPDGYWTTTVEQKKLMVHRAIWILHYGEIPKGMALDHIDGNPGNNRISNLRVVPSEKNHRNACMLKNNTSGYTGVSLWRKGTNSATWVASWKNLEGKKVRRWFAVNKYGYEEALQMAIEARGDAIEELNRQGAGYTARHGKGESKLNP